MQTASADYFTGLRDSLTGLVLDVARSKYIDVETVNDTKDVKDRIDAREARGMSIGTVVLIGAATVGGVLLLRRVL